MVMMASADSGIKNGTIPVWKIIQSMLIGVGGNLICFMFLLTFLHVLEAFKFIPWIVAFNTALTGYSLIDKTRNRMKPKRLVSAAAGVTTALITGLVLAMVSIFMVGENLVTIPDWILYVAIGTVCSVLGALLAIKYHEL